MSTFSSDGSINVSVVAGTSYTGLYAADGSYNVVVASGSSYVGAQHPCGAYWVTVATSPAVGSLPLRAPDGSLYVSVSPYTNGGTHVTVVSGSFSSLTAPVLVITSTSSQANPTFTIDVDNTIVTGDTINLQVQITGGNWSSLVSNTTHTITSGEDTAGEINLSLSALVNNTYDARCDVSDGVSTSSWSNIVTFTIAVSVANHRISSTGNARISSAGNNRIYQ